MQVLPYSIGIIIYFNLYLTYVFVKVDDGSGADIDKETIKESNKTNETFTSVACGKVIPLEEVKDEAFSSGVLAYGAAIIPIKGTIYSFADK